MENDRKENSLIPGVITVRQKSTTFSAIQWRGDNEEAIRKFVGDDTMLNFRDEGLRVWNGMDFSWIECPVFHFIVMDRNRNLYPMSSECFRENYSEE